MNVLLNRNTSYLAISANKKYLFSFQEVSKDKNPIVLSFSIESDFTLKPINEQPINGGLPCHLLLVKDSTLLAVSCYETGSVHLFPVDANGYISTSVQDIYHLGKSVNKERQEAAHAHMISFENNEFFGKPGDGRFIKRDTFGSAWK